MRTRIVCLLFLSMVYGCAQTTSVQKVDPVTGRAIAPTMSVDGAAWLDRPEREREEQPQKAIDALHLAPGMSVGEVGAGTGFYAIRIAKRIQPGGVYYANDLQPAMLTLLERNAAAQKVTNIKTLIGTATDPHLPRGSLDYVLMVDVYHELSEPQTVLRNIAESLKPGGRLVLLEFRKEDPNVPIRPEHEMTVQDVKAELSAEGYVLDKLVETLPWQHMFFFRPPAR
ncbi:MAG TPA: class I SAM-dependent methyltransferase [Bryobacteraceae bacterium]|jgi:ubiquinone/menaquinone biosynthesis C-methylase UbiE|nr:class I SAM-dependent methyltransferase [Bryobacteraceae bacterium]